MRAMLRDDLRARRGRAVRVTPPPWVYGPEGLKRRLPWGGRWKVADVGPRTLTLRLDRAGVSLTLLWLEIHSIRKPDVLRLNVQVLVVDKEVSVEPLPPFYWHPL